jgi:HEAT repeat protein
MSPQPGCHRWRTAPASRLEVADGNQPARRSRPPCPCRDRRQAETAHVARFLQEQADPAAVPALRQAAELDLPYREYDQARALSRKCMWALSDIRNAEAIAALQSLSKSRNPVVRDLATYHLAKVRNGEPPSRVSQRRER